MPCKGVSLMHPELVPALCTHRPSLLLIEFCDKDLVLWTFVFTAVEGGVSKVFVLRSKYFIEICSNLAI